MVSKHAGGLAGVIAGETAISTVGKTGVGLTYRGYDIEQLASLAAFEEVACLFHAVWKTPHTGPSAS